MSSTQIRAADWVIAWDEGAKRHVYRRDADIVFEGDTVTYVGPGFAGQADEVVDGRGLMVMPGLVDIHSHPGHEPAYRGIREEHGVPNMYMTGLYERSQAFDTSDRELRLAAVEVALCELLKSGVTSLCDISPLYEGWTEIFERSGMRGFLAPGYASARWKLENDHGFGFDWDEARGRRGMEAALAFIDGLVGHPSGRLSGVVSPMQIENCSDDLLRDSFDAAGERKVPFTLHVSQGVLEVHEMIRRHGRTPIQHAKDIGILGPGSVLGHAIFLDSHSWIRWWTREDLGILAESGCAVAHCPTPFARYGHIMESFGDYVRAGVTMGIGVLGPGSVLGHAIFLDTHSWIRWWTKEDLSILAECSCAVAHCPTPFARYGHIMESFGDYVRAGVTMGIGTDTTPHNMLEEIRKAGTFARIAARDINNVSTGMLLHAATVGGAKALLRDDIGRLALGMKADLVLVDLHHPDMMPARDPLRSLVFHAADRAVRDVYVAGRKIVADGKVTTLDHAAAGERLSEAQRRMMASSTSRDYRGRTTDEIAPLSLPVV